MAVEFTDMEKREAAEQLLVDWMNYPGAFNEQVPTREQAINLQCQVNRLTREVERAHTLISDYRNGWISNDDDERISEWLARNGGTK